MPAASPSILTYISAHSISLPLTLLRTVLFTLLLRRQVW